MRTSDRAEAFRDWCVTTGVTVVAFVVYVITMCRSVSFIDAGELAAVACVLGIAHPTGYPLFTLIAHLAQWFSFGSNQVIVLNGLSSLTVALAVGVFSRIAFTLGRIAGLRGRSLVRSAAGAASLVLAFSTTVWAQSVAIEVYGLHLLLLLLTMLQFLKSYEDDSGGSGEIPRSLLAAVFLLGLSFANHLTTLLIIPAVLTLFIRQYGLSRGALSRGAKLLPFFFLGLSVYLYLPLRAHAHPPVQWGYPAELERLLWHVSGKQYRNWMFSGFESAAKQFSYFLEHFSSEFNWLVIAVLIYGFIRTYRLERTLFWYLAVAFTGCILYSINYDIYDIDSYFLLAYAACGGFIVFGMIGVLEKVWRKRSRAVKIGSVILLSGLSVVQLAVNRASVDESDNFLTEDYVRNVFSNTEANALIITYQWDYFVSPSLYYQIVGKERPDIVVLDKELLRRTWYFVQLKNRYPWLLEHSQDRVDAFLRELYKFEHDLPYDPRVIERTYVEMINDFVDKAMGARPVYVGPEIEAEFGARYSRIPSGLMFRLSSTPDSLEIGTPRIEYRPASINTRLTQGIRSLYAKMLTNTGALFLRKNRLSDARYCLERAVSIDPTFQPANSLLHELGNSGARIIP